MLRVMRGASAAGRWEFAARAPGARLRGLVRRYAGYHEDAARPVRRREVPTGDVHLIISFGPRIRLLDPGDPARAQAAPASFVATVGSGWSVTEFTGAQHGVQVTLTPVGAGMLLGVPLDRLAGEVVELGDVLGARAGELTGRLAEAPDWAARFDLLDAVLPTWLAEARQPPPAAVWAWRRLCQTDGRLPVAALAEELGCTRQYLAAAFRAHVGVPPKTLARVLRCQRAIRLLEQGAARDLATLAAECGYADQAHLSRDFRQLTGLPPSRWPGRAPEAAALTVP